MRRSIWIFCIAESQLHNMRTKAITPQNSGEDACAHAMPGLASATEWPCLKRPAALARDSPPAPITAGNDTEGSGTGTLHGKFRGLRNGTPQRAVCACPINGHCSLSALCAHSRRCHQHLHTANHRAEPVHLVSAPPHRADLHCASRSAGASRQAPGCQWPWH